MFKRSISILLSLILIIGLLAGCSGKPADNSGSGQGTGGAKDKEQPKEKQITWLFVKGGFDGKPDNDVIKADIEKNSGVKFNQIAPPAANYAEKVNVILASNDLPDAVKLPKMDDLFNYADQGALLPLDDLLKDAPNLTKNIPKAAWEMCRVNGKIYGIPVWTSEHRYNFIIRGDWLKKLNLQEPKTLDDLYNVYKAFKERDPDGNGKADTYGISGTGLESFEPIFGAFGVMGVHRGYWYEENGKLLPQAINPYAKKALELLRKWYAEGLIDPEWITTKNEAQLNEKAMKNQFGSTHRWWTWEPKVEIEMRKIDPNVEWRRIAPPVGPDGKSAVRGVPLVNFPVAVLKTAKDPKAVIQLFDWLHSEKGMMTAYSGVEGVHWEKKPDGKVVTLPQFDKDAKWIQWYACFENEQPLLQVETPLVQSRRDSLKWNIITDKGDGLITDAGKKYSSDLQVLVEDFYASVITGKASVNDFDRFAEQWKQKGGNQWTDEINKLNAKSKTAK